MAPRRLTLKVKPPGEPLGEPQDKLENTSASVQDESSTKPESSPKPDRATHTAPKKKGRPTKRRPSKQTKSTATDSNPIPTMASPRRSRLQNESEISSLDLGASSTEGPSQPSEARVEAEVGHDSKLGSQVPTGSDAQGTSQSLRVDHFQSQVMNSDRTSITDPSLQRPAQPSKTKSSKIHRTAQPKNAPTSKAGEKPGEKPVEKAVKKPVPTYGDLWGYGYGYGYGFEPYHEPYTFSSATDSDTPVRQSTPASKPREVDNSSHEMDLDEVNDMVQKHEHSSPLFPDVNPDVNLDDYPDVVFEGEFDDWFN